MKINFHRFTNFLTAFVVLVTALFPGLQPSFSVRAQAQDGIHREYNAETGKVKVLKRHGVFRYGMCYLLFLHGVQ